MSRSPQPKQEEIEFAHQALLAVVESDGRTPIKPSKKIPLTIPLFQILLENFFVPAFHLDGFEEIIFTKKPSSIHLKAKKGVEAVTWEFELQGWHKKRADFIIQCLLMIKLRLDRKRMGK